MPTPTTSQPVSAPLNDEDRHILDQVDDSLAAGIQIRDWWRKTDAERSYREQYELQRAFNPALRSLAFFDKPELAIGEFPVIEAGRGSNLPRFQQLAVLCLRSARQGRVDDCTIGPLTKRRQYRIR